MSNEKLFAMPFSKIYDNYIKKAEKKNRTKDELDEIICWLFGYDLKSLETQVNNNCSLKAFIDEAPCINKNASLIKGKVCGVQVEEIEDLVMRHVRYMDKLVDELAKGKKLAVIFR